MKAVGGARVWRRLGALSLTGPLAFLGLVWWWIFSGGLPLRPEVVTPVGRFRLAASLPIARTEAGGAACEGRLYVVGGLGPRAQTLTSAMAYDPKAAVWQALPDLPQPINHPGVACAAGRLYVVGGFDPLGIRIRGIMLARWDPVDTVWIYDPTAARWSRGARMPARRGAGGIAVAAGALWYVGGINEDRQVSADLFRLELKTGSWKRMTSMGQARDHLRMEAVAASLYAISGHKDDLRFNFAEVERYSIETGVWSRVADFPSPRGGLSSAAVDGRIYTFGGEHIWTCSERIERYDPATNVWESLGSLPEARHGIVAGVIDGRIHMVSGGRRPRISISGIHRVLELPATP